LKVHEFARRRFPDGSGFEVCSRLREGEPGRAWDRDVPVIMVSARGDPVDRVRGFSRGCDDYVVKPFVHDELRPPHARGAPALQGRPPTASLAFLVS
jgi:CheY-like chemotaxis protein